MRQIAYPILGSTTLCLLYGVGCSPMVGVLVFAQHQTQKVSDTTWLLWVGPSHYKQIRAKEYRWAEIVLGKAKIATVLAYTTLLRDRRSRPSFAQQTEPLIADLVKSLPDYFTKTFRASFLAHLRTKLSVKERRDIILARFRIAKMQFSGG